MRLPALLLLFTISAIPLEAQSPFLEPSSANLITDYLFLQSLHPHEGGSANEKRIAQFIEERLTLLRLPHSESDFSRAEGGHSFSPIIQAAIPGVSRETILIVIPLNHPLAAERADDGSFGLALGLRLLDHFRKNKPPLSLTFVFLGGEYEEGGEPFWGTRHFLRNFYPVERHAVLYLDFKSFPASCNVQYGGRGIVAPLWLVNTGTTALSRAAGPFSIETGRLPVFRPGLETVTTPEEEFLQADLPALLIASGGPATAPPDPGAADRIFAAITDLLTMFPDGIPREWDRHFIFLSLPLLPLLVVSETAYLAGVVFFLLVLLVTLMWNIARLKKYFATLRRNLWNIPLFIAAAFAILLADTILLNLSLLLRDMPTLWTQLPAAFFILKIGVYFSAAALLFRLARVLPFSKNGSFYSAAALVFTVVCVFVVAWINISFVHYFLWSLGCAVLFALGRSRWLKLVCLILFPLPVLVFVFELFAIPELKICEIILFDKMVGNLLLTVVVLPFTLLLIRIRLLFPYRKKNFWSSKSLIFMGVNVAAVAAALIIVIFHEPYSAARPQPVLAEQIIDFDRKSNQLSLSSPAPLGEIEIVDKDGVRPLNIASRRYLMPLGAAPDYLSWEVFETSFATRKNLDLRLRFRGQPLLIRAALSSDGDFKLYDANFPVELVSGGLYRLSVGMNPPPDLPLKLTLPAGRTYTLALEVYYRNRSSDVDIHGDHIALDHRLLFKRSLTLSL
jgi:hypothetical protein